MIFKFSTVTDGPSIKMWVIKTALSFNIENYISDSCCLCVQFK